MKGSSEIQRLRAGIRSGKLEPGAMVGTEAAFAERWGLARNTVRRAMETLVDEGLLERRPGKGLFVRCPSTVTRVVQVVVPNTAWKYCLAIARGAQRAGVRAGIQIQIYDAHGRMDLDLEVIRRLPDRMMDGAIIISLHHPRFSEVLYELKASGFPFVLADQRLRDLEVPPVEIESYRGGYLVGQALAEMAHRRVAFLGPMDLQVLQERLSGFRDALADAQVLLDRSLIVDLGGEGLTDFLIDRADACVGIISATLERHDRPTAVFDACGDVTPQIYQAAKRIGLRIPEDLSVVTFEDLHLIEPEAACLRHPWQEVGKLALEMLVRQMDRRRAKKPIEFEHHVLKGEWVPGRSLVRPAESRARVVRDVSH